MHSRKKNTPHIPLLSTGMLRAVFFVVLVITAIGFWLYTKRIIDNVRVFQKTVITTQEEIYKGIIDPLSSDTAGISSELFQKGVIESPFPIIFSDEYNNPIPGLWRNVDVAPDDMSEEAQDRLRKIMSRMDNTNSPDSIFIQALKLRVDTLLVYEIPPSRDLPYAITDQVGTPLFLHNIAFATENTIDLLDEIYAIDQNPIRFSKQEEPPIILYGTMGHGRWPLVVTTLDGQALYWKGVAEPWTDSAEYDVDDLERQLRSMRMRGRVDTLMTQHIASYDTLLLHYGDPEFLALIVWLPVLEFLVLAILIAIGFIGFKNITRAEQHSIWVGMAKETAHQLGTPISSIDGWLELLQTERDKALIDQAIEEIGTDVKRLSRVAARFSSIGSHPELQPLDISEVINEVLDYYRKRVPNMGHRVELTGSYHHLSLVSGNRELLNWAFENLIKNSLAAIDNRNGKITVTGAMSKDFSMVVIDFKDNGKGIPIAIQKKIMIPGFTTKKRGWGLGLSLVKRIIENYHGGGVYLLESRPGEGSTIRVVLPAQEEREDKSSHEA